MLLPALVVPQSRARGSTIRAASPMQTTKTHPPVCKAYRARELGQSSPEISCRLRILHLGGLDPALFVESHAMGLLTFGLNVTLDGCIDHT